MYFKVKNILLLLILYLLSLHANAQKTEWSISEKVKAKIIFTEIMGEINGNYFICKYNKKIKQDFIIEKYSHDMKMVKDYQFKVDKNISIEKMLIFDKHVLIFYSFYDSKQKLFGLFVNIIDEDLELKTKDRFIASTKFNFENNVFLIKKDEFKEKLLILCPENITDGEIYYRIRVLNNTLIELHNEKVSLSAKENNKIDQIYFADSNIIFIVKIRESNRNSKGKHENIRLLCYKFDKKKVLAFNLYNDSFRMSNILLKYNPLTKIIYIAGFCSHFDNDKFNGIAVFRVFPAIDSSSLMITMFGRDLFIGINGRNNEGGITDFYPRALVLRDDGGIIFTAEYFNIEKEVYTSYYSMSSNYVKYYYQYGDMLLISVNPDGTTDWSKLIRKEQVTSNDEGYSSSFLTGVLEDKIMLLYNDLSKNKCNLMYYKVNPKGNVDSQVLVNGKNFDGMLTPKMGKQVTNDVVLIPGFQRRKSFVLMKITF